MFEEPMAPNKWAPDVITFKPHDPRRPVLTGLAP